MHMLHIRVWLHVCVCMCMRLHPLEIVMNCGCCSSTEIWKERNARIRLCNPYHWSVPRVEQRGLLLARHFTAN